MEKVETQRAIAMAAITGILLDDDDMSVEDIKGSLLKALAFIIDNDLLVGDLIEGVTMKAAQNYCEQMAALDEVKEQLDVS